MNWRSGIVVALLLAVMSSCLFGFVLNCKNSTFRELETVLLSVQWILLICLTIWCGSFIFLTFGLNKLPLIGLLLISILAYFTSYTSFIPR